MVHSKKSLAAKVLLIDLFLNNGPFKIAYHISLVKDQTNYCKNSQLVLDVKQLNKIMKLYYFHTIKALRYGQDKIKMYYGTSWVKKQLSGKRSVKYSYFYRFYIQLT